MVRIEDFTLSTAIYLEKLKMKGWCFFSSDLQDSNRLWHDGPLWPVLGKEYIMTMWNNHQDINDEIHSISLKSLDHFDGGFAWRRKDGKVQNRHTPGSCLCYFIFVFVFAEIDTLCVVPNMSQSCLVLPCQGCPNVQALWQNGTRHTPGSPVC